MNANFLNRARWSYRLGRGLSRPLPPIVVRRLRSSGRRLLFLESFGHHGLISLFLDLIHLRGDAIHHFVHALAVSGKLFHESGELRVQAESEKIKNQKGDAAHDETCHGAGQPELHEDGHDGVQQEGDDDSDQYGDEEDVPVVQQRDSRGHGQYLNAGLPRCASYHR